ncbi:phenylacetaldoxime dehydratase [Fusarium sporotrichioides]|uniref:Phenylacetaldoxime dehydratase n=1 Tax=Fusarium sporotrichioides TaxID=5514 RepID=A0A395SVP5_FUSSP|nr:phenylacetaldoxime dehydratase [Fusarium sporotrichioides]
MLRAHFPTAHHFTVSVFGCQYHAEAPSDAKSKLIERFDGLIDPAAIHVEHMEQNDIPSKVWMSYWESPQKFKQWWENDETSSFWASLPEDAGFWRETFSLPATRAMYEGTGKGSWGFGHCGKTLLPLTTKTGYWGAYRSRMTPDFEGDTFSSPVPTYSDQQPPSEKIRPGRVRVTDFPDNLCIVVEGQVYDAMEERERDYWNENFDGLTKQWVTNVVTSGTEQGMVVARACHGFKAEKKLGATDAKPTQNGIFPGLDYVRQTQILIWQDISKMEHMGRYDKTHVTLRRNFMKAYGPGGEMEGGDLLLWVDLGILKSNEIDAEYVGCYESTGFLKLEKGKFFNAESVETAKLPAFFDKPIESKPIEW